jgi:hypothetical protein
MLASRIAVVALALTVALPMAGAQAQRRGGGWGWGGPAFGFAVPPFYYSPPYYYPPPVYYPPPAYPPYPSGSPYGYTPGYYGSGGTTFNQQPYGQPGYSGLIRLDPNYCGTPVEPKPCRR